MKGNSRMSTLNIYSEPDFSSDIVCTLELPTQLVISEEESTESFYKVYTEFGLAGFCEKSVSVDSEISEEGARTFI